MDNENQIDRNDDYFANSIEIVHTFFISKSKKLFKEMETNPNTRIDFILANINTLINILERLYNLEHSEDNKEVDEDTMKKVQLAKNILLEKLKKY